jgi:hypothetical protein
VIPFFPPENGNSVSSWLKPGQSCQIETFVGLQHC